MNDPEDNQNHNCSKFSEMDVTSDNKKEKQWQPVTKRSVSNKLTKHSTNQEGLSWFTTALQLLLNSMSNYF